MAFIINQIWMAEGGSLVNYLSPFVRDFEFTSIDAKEIVSNNIFKTCGSCEREFVMLESYLTSLGKKVKIKVRTDETIEGTSLLKKKLKIK